MDCRPQLCKIAVQGLGPRAGKVKERLFLSFLPEQRHDMVMLSCNASTSVMEPETDLALSWNHSHPKQVISHRRLISHLALRTKEDSSANEASTNGPPAFAKSWSPEQELGNLKKSKEPRTNCFQTVT